MLRHRASFILINALGVVELNPQVLQLLNLCLEALVGHFLVEGTELKVSRRKAIRDLDTVPQPRRNLRPVVGVSIAHVEQKDGSVVLHVPDHSTDRLVH